MLGFVAMAHSSVGARGYVWFPIVVFYTFRGMTFEVAESATDLQLRFEGGRLQIVVRWGRRRRRPA
eukprot:8267029-Lingulodinium_polyedra.AAC.1